MESIMESHYGIIFQYSLMYSKHASIILSYFLVLFNFFLLLKSDIHSVFHSCARLKWEKVGFLVDASCTSGKD